MDILLAFLAVAVLIGLYFWSIVTGRFQAAVYWLADRFMR